MFILISELLRYKNVEIQMKDPKTIKLLSKLNET